MSNTFLRTLNATMVDILNCFGIPLNTAHSIFEQLLEKRRKLALDILFSEVRQGNVNNVEQSEIISIIVRYLRDAEEGVARNNLKLMAKVIYGMAEKSTLNSQSFLKYANVLSILTSDEINILGIMASENGCYLSARDKVLKCFSEEDSLALLQGLLRTGLISFSQGIESKYIEGTALGHGDDIEEYKKVETDFWTNYSFTRLMEEILQYVDLKLLD